MAIFYFRLYVLLLTCVWTATKFVLAVPYLQPPSFSFDQQFNISAPFPDFDPVPVRRQAAKPPLRILALGASIVWGFRSTDGNGFRKPLRDALRFDGWDVDMVGSIQSGTMVDRECEATKGNVLTQIYSDLNNSLPYKPNVVLINGGTNDADGGLSRGIYDRMLNILNRIWGAPDMADTCVMLSTLIPSKDPVGASQRIFINSDYRKLVRDMSAQGKCIILADMDPAQGPAAGWISITTDMADNIHPNDVGYRKMAYVFYKAINSAFRVNKIKPPSAPLVVAPPGCDKVYNNGHDAGGLTQQGYGAHDGIYTHDSQNMGFVVEITSDFDRDQWRFARLYGRDRDDLLAWYNKTESEHAFAVWKNNGGGNFAKIADLNPDLFCIPRGLHFIDMNGDGYDDIVCIDPDGNAYMSLNQKDGTATTPPSFKRVSETALIKKTEGYAQDRVRLADIDGDGRGDYCILDDGGNIHCWRNAGVADVPREPWEALGQRFNAKGKPTINGVRFEDINGDGRDDWMWVDEDGAVETWTNSRSCKKGKLGDGLNCAWRQGFHKDATSGNTHYGVGVYAPGENLRDAGRIHFGRIYSEVAAFGELPLQDYIYINHTEVEDTGKHVFRFQVWKNLGHGAAKLRADGDKYCNMKGDPTGREDYVWTLSTGEMTLFPNKGASSISKGESFWGPREDSIWKPPNGRNLDRRDLHLADWNSDGLCDVIWVDPDNNNKVEVWINRYKDAGNKWEWAYNANPAPNLHCSEKRGLGLHDLPVRFADLTGNGRADYLCIQPNGKVTGFLHNGDNNWEDVGQIKAPQDKDRANLRWTDVNGDGKDDMLWVDKFTGDATVWYNRGRGDPAVELGSAFHWDLKGKAYAGNVAGTCMYYPDLDGNGRADQHSIENTITNIAETSLNPSCGLTDRTGDDPGGLVDPQLPVQPDTGEDDGSGSGGGGGGGGGGDGNNGGGAPYYPDPHDNDFLPVCGDYDKYNNLDDIANGAGIIPLNCGPTYVLFILQDMLVTAKSDYETIIADGYDYYFDLYAGYVRDTTPKQFLDYVNDNHNKLFTCVVTEEVVCCRNCHEAYPGQNCQYCDNSQCPTSPYGHMSTHINVTEPCPSDYSQRGVSDPSDTARYPQTVYWSLKNDDAKAEFAANALDIIGPAATSKVLFQRVGSPDHATYQNRGCESDDYYYTHDLCTWTDWWLNYPILDHFDTSDVVNPKDIVSQALGNTATLIDDLTAGMWEVLGQDYDGYDEDLVDAVTLPVLLVQQAIEAMKSAIEIGKKIDEENKKEFIITLLSAIFFVLPFVGEVAEVGLISANLGRVLAGLGEIGDAALGIYGAVEDPSSAPLAILGIVLGAKGIRDRETTLEAAQLRRAITDAELGSLSPMIKQRMDDIGLSVSKDVNHRNLCFLPN